MSRVVRFIETEGPDALRLIEEADPIPGDGEVLLRIHALGLNRAEAMFARGAYLFAPELPSRIGIEGVGSVIAAGPGVEGYRPGERVSILPNMDPRLYGLAGETALAPADALMPVPAGLDDEAAAALWMAYLTAYGGMVEAGGLEAGQTVVITAASSSVGYAAIDIAKAIGARVIATTRTDVKRQNLLDAGADEVLATEGIDVGKDLRDMAGKPGVNVFFDAVGGAQTEKLAKAAARDAAHVVYGILSMETTPFPVTVALMKGIRMQGFHVVFDLIDRPERFARAKAFLHQKLEAGAFTPRVDKVFFLDQIADAYRYLEAGGQNGKIVVTTARPS